MHRTKVRVVEDALDANTPSPAPTAPTSTAHGVRVVNLMSAPGAGKTTLLERVARASSAACASACWRATCRASLRRRPPGAAARPGRPDQHRSGLRRRVPPRRQHGALGAADAAAGRDRPAGDRERRQPRLPGRVPGRRGRPGDGLLGHRGRGQAAQVPADVPHLRAGAGQQDRPAAAPRLRPRAASWTTSTPCIPACERMLVERAHRRGGRRVPRLAGRGRRARSGRRRDATPRRAGRARRAARAPDRGQRGVLRAREAERHRAALPPDGRALRARRAAGRARRARRRRARTSATSPSSSSTR